MTFGRNLCHIGTSKLICEADRWTGSYVMRFLLEGHSEQTMILHLCGCEKYTTVLCFSIKGGDARVPAPFHTWGVEVFLEQSLDMLGHHRVKMCFHFGTSEVNSSRRYHGTFSSKKFLLFLLYILYIYIYIYIYIYNEH